jgi:hypothetical protein
MLRSIMIFFLANALILCLVFTLGFMAGEDSTNKNPNRGYQCLDQ